MKDVNCPFKVGDVLDCIEFGGNNSCVGHFEGAVKGDKDLVVKAIRSDSSKYVWSLDNGKKIYTLETECGRFLWGSTKYYKVSGKTKKEGMQELEKFVHNQAVFAKDLEKVDPTNKKLLYNGFSRVSSSMSPRDKRWFYTRNSYDKEFSCDLFRIVTVEDINEDKLEQIMNGTAILFCESNYYYHIGIALIELVREKIRSMGWSADGFTLGARYFFYKQTHFLIYFEKKYLPAAARALPVIEITELFNMTEEAVERSNYSIF